MTRLNTDLDTLTQLWLNDLIAAAPDEAGDPGRLVALDLSTPNGAYLLGLTQLLAALGALQLDRATLTIRIVSPQAGYLLRLLADLLRSSHPLVTDWTAEGLTTPGLLQHPFSTAVDLLAALDHRRRELLAEAPPLRTILAAAGLITRQQQDGALSYLLVYDGPAGAWQLPGGRYDHRDGSLRSTLLRELSEELGCGLLREPTDLLLSELTPELELVRDSPTYGLRTSTRFHLFAVELKRELPLLPGQLRWVREAEILAGRTADQQPVSVAPLLQLLRQGNAPLQVHAGA